MNSVSSVVKRSLVGCSKSYTAGSPRAVQGGERVRERVIMGDKIVKSEEEWKKYLTPEQFEILRKKGTERAFTGKYWDFHGEGTYVCAACGFKLFVSGDKFDSGCGWPSFTQPIRADSVETHEDHSHFMKRIEVVCPRCGGHLGHVFEDGPKPTGLRYCINSAAIELKPEEKK